MPSEKPRKPRQLSTDKEFAAALDVATRMHSEGYVEFISTPSGGIRTTVEESVLPRYLEGTSLEQQRFQRVFTQEIALFVATALARVTPEWLRHYPAFEELSETERSRLLRRAQRVSEAFPVEELRKYAEAKRRASADVLDSMSSQVFRQSSAREEGEPLLPVAIVSISADRPSGEVQSMGPPGGPSLREALGIGPHQTLVMQCTLQDVRYLASRLKQIENALVALAEEKGDET